MKKLTLLPVLLICATILLQCTTDDENNITSQIDSEQIVAEEVEEEAAAPETVMDIDGNTYTTITIGEQVWMLENLKTTTYNDGTPITQYTIQEHTNNWGATAPEYVGQGFYQWADTNDLNGASDEELAVDQYGAMYNYFAIESGMLAPEGWRIPSAADFAELQAFLENDGNTGNISGSLKTETGWTDNPGNGFNTYGFNTIPNGYISAFGSASAGGSQSTWATTEVIDNGGNISSRQRMLVSLSSNDSNLVPVANAMQIGSGVRCIKIQ